MVLQRANFDIPAQFVFRPFQEHWLVGYAEILGWVPERDPMLEGLGLQPEPERLLATVHFSDSFDTSGMLGGPAECEPGNVVEILRDNIPSETLAIHENRKNTPDLSGRGFQVLVCYKPEFTNQFLTTQVRAGETTKNAWAMLKEFFDLDDEDWVSNLRGFLNRWGLWSFGYGFKVPARNPMPGFCLAFPHKVREERERFRKGILPQNSRRWLAIPDAALRFSKVDNPPYFRVERHYCEHAIRAIITIDHLAKRRWGFCKRCHKLFERETEHKKNYCSRRCIQAAGVERWRKKQRKAKRTKGAKRNAKS